MSDAPTNHSQISDAVRRRAADYAARVQAQYGSDASFDTVHDNLARDWAAQGGNENLDWSLVRGIVKEAWGRRDASSANADAVANAGGYDHPPTFGEAGVDTPRNRDEPNQ